MLALIAPAHAAEWWMQPAVRAGAEYNDNIRFATGTTEKATGYFVSPDIGFGVAEENWRVTGGANLKSVRYSSVDDLDADDYRASLNGRYNTQRNAWTVDGSSAKQSLLASDVVDADTGLSRQDRDRRTKALRPAWSWAADERTQLRTDYGYTDVRYDYDAAADLFDYRQNSGAITLLRDITPRWQISASFGYADFQTRNPTPGTTDYTARSETTTAQVGFTHMLSETLRIGLTGGSRRTKFDQVVRCAVRLPSGVCLFPGFSTRSETDSGSVYSLDVSQDFPRSRIVFRMARSVEPSGGGSQVESDSATVTVDHRLSERLQLTLSGQGYRHRTVGGDTTLVDRDYYSGGPRISWMLTEHWTLDSAYRYTHLKYPGGGAEANQNIVSMTLTYRWSRWTISR